MITLAFYFLDAFDEFTYAELPFPPSDSGIASFLTFFLNSTVAALRPPSLALQNGFSSSQGGRLEDAAYSDKF